MFVFVCVCAGQHLCCFSITPVVMLQSISLSAKWSQMYIYIHVNYIHSRTGTATQWAYVCLFISCVTMWVPWKHWHWWIKTWHSNSILPGQMLQDLLFNDSGHPVRLAISPASSEIFCCHTHSHTFTHKHTLTLRSRLTLVLLQRRLSANENHRSDCVSK